MKGAFTTATINYLPKAGILAGSFLDHHPGYRFFIFLIDPKDERTEPFKRENLDFISIENLEIEELPQMLSNLNISEISFSLKPILAEYILNNFQETEHLFYFDGDIKVYDRLREAEDMFGNFDLLLTPHFTHPVNDEKVPSELDILRTGLYNMGFAGFKNSDNARKILAWWKKRVLDFGYENHDLGLTADQMWMSLAPLFFRRVGIIDHLGYNFAYWNVHERKLSVINQDFYVNETVKLVFVHFADFNPEKPDQFSTPKHFNRILPGENKALLKLCEEYAVDLKNHRLNEYKSIRSKYAISYRKQAWRKLDRGDKKSAGAKQTAIWLIYLLPSWFRKIMRKSSLFILRNIK